ncbi:MAG: MBL fold metallo-hydrolase [Microgenomates group bacterium]
MFKLKTGYFISGIITGLILLFNFFQQLPDGKLHIVFCNVGQGDATYIQFPRGKDMLIDGGPGGQTPKVLGCLAKHMSMFDREIDVVVLTHPQEDHLGGLNEIVKRYQVQYFVYSGRTAMTEGFTTLIKQIREKQIPVRIAVTGEDIVIGKTQFSVLFPQPSSVAYAGKSTVLGATDVNESCLVLRLSYGSFDALFMGDADSQVDPELVKQPFRTQGKLEVLKVPHHGSKTGMTEGFFTWIGLTDTAIISVGKNMYGHPAPETLQQLTKRNMHVQRTDQEGDIEIITDGKTWSVKTAKTK